MKKLLLVLLGLLYFAIPSFSKVYAYGDSTLEFMETPTEIVRINDEIGHLTKLIEKSIEDNNLNEHISALYWRRGTLYKQEGNYTSTLEDYNQALKYSPNNIKLIKVLADLQIEMDDYGRALCNANKAIKLQPKNSENYMYRAKIYFLMKYHQKAINDYTKAIVLKPKNPEAFELRGYIELIIGRKDKGFLDLKYAKEQYYELGNYDKYQEIMAYTNELQNTRNNIVRKYEAVVTHSSLNPGEELEKINHHLENMERAQRFQPYDIDDTEYIHLVP